jgi:hypothetical protein
VLLLVPLLCRIVKLLNAVVMTQCFLCSDILTVPDCNITWVCTFTAIFPLHTISDWSLPHEICSVALACPDYVVLCYCMCVVCLLLLTWSEINNLVHRNKYSVGCAMRIKIYWLNGQLICVFCLQPFH